MERPKSVQIGAFSYLLDWKPGPPDIDGEWGHLDTCAGVIVMRESIPSQRIAATFIHEVTHAGLDAMGYGKRFDEEAMAVFSGLFWPMFWRDNLDAFAWWIGLLT